MNRYTMSPESGRTAEPADCMVAEPDIRVLVNGEYLVTVVDVVYRITSDLPAPGAAMPQLTRRDGGTAGGEGAVRRRYGTFYYGGPFTSSETVRRKVHRRVWRDLERLRASGVAVVDRDGLPLDPWTVVSALPW